MLHNHVQSASSDSPIYPLDGPGPEQISPPLTNGRSQYPSAIHTRETSLTRGRPQQPASQTYAPSFLPSSRAASVQPHGAESGLNARAPPTVDTGLQRRTSNSYGHHRQTSVIHGLQHSRGPSFNSPTSASPLTPESLSNGPIHSGYPTAAAAAAARRGQYSNAESSSTYTSPVSPYQGHTQGHSIDSLIDTTIPTRDAGPSQPRKRKEQSRTRRGHGYQSSSSQPEPRTPGEYALHHLFHAFVLRADQRINYCITLLDSSVAPVEQACAPGVDSGFDQLISSLGHISRQGPKPLVDSLMLWRKGKGDAAANLKKQVYQQRLQAGGPGLSLPISLPRRHTEPLQALGESGIPQANADNASSTLEESLTQDYILADRRATISVYILCRVLVAIFEQSDLASITQDLANKLEDIVFTQMREVEPAQILTSSIRLSNWRIYGEVLGHMSRLDFVNVTARFTQQLDIWQQEFAKSSATATARDIESRLELLLLGMRHLHISATRESAYAVAEFLRTVASLFADAHGPRVKQAYCQLFERLLTAVASNPECFQTVPKWKDFIDAINVRLGNMLIKVRHWTTGFPVSILLLCISPLEVFSAQWFPMISTLAPKLKDRSTRGQALQAICQLVWTYLTRINEPLQVRSRRLEEIIRITVPQGRKTHVSSEPSVSVPLVQLIRVIGYASQEYCFRTIIFPLIHYDMFQSSRNLKIENMEPERMVIGIRAFLAIMSDLEQDGSGSPPFPGFNLPAQSLDGLPSSPMSMRTNLGIESPIRTTFEDDDPPSISVNIARLDENARQYYLQFCQILGKITILCDNTFGGQATLNEKFSTTSLTPKTPLVDAFTLARSQDVSTTDQRQYYYELLHVAIQALPRCFTDHIPLSPLINLLCTGSAHVQTNIATSATQSLKAIARQGHAQAVAIAFPRFIFHYDSQYSTMSDEGRLGPAHIEATLSLYLELLQIWTEQLKQKAVANSPDARDRAGLTSSRAMQMELTNVIPLVDEIEAYGLFFLCSQSRRVRAFAIKVLRLVVQFDKVLGQDEPSRIIKILENQSSKVLDLQDDALSVAERSRLQKDKRGTAGQSTLIEICSSEVSYDATLWFKAFPNLIRVIFDACPNAIALCRGTITDRLMMMQNDIEGLSETMNGSSALYEYRTQGRSSATPAEIIFDQWKLYLIMACVTISSPGAQSQSQLAEAAHARKTSKGPDRAQDKLSSARALFSAIIPMLGAAPDAIRDAVVSALGSINRKLYRTLLESLQYAVIKCNDEAKARINHQRTPSSPQRSQKTERLRTEVTHVYKLTASFLRYEDIYSEEWILHNLVTYTRDLRIFLSDTDVQNDWRFQRLRYHFCGLVDEVFEGVNRSKTPSRWMPFESRKSAFALMEDWCGYSAEQNLFDQHHGHARDLAERMNANAATEKEKNNLRVAALSAMATLCAGPITIKTDSNAILSFNLQRMLSWIDTIFATSNHKMHVIGRRALRLLLVNNPEHLAIIEHAVEQCYRTDSSTALESYFGVLCEVLIEQVDYPVAFWKILSLIVFTLGNENREIRMKSANLIRTLDERQHKSSNLQDFDISISDKTRAVYKLAQFEYSKRLSKAHSNLAFMIFSEFSLHYKAARNDHQRNMVAAILPWLQVVELQVDSGTGGPTAVSYMLLANMFEITICSSNAMHNEVQALWQALATGPHAGNVQLILDFIIYLSLDRRDQNFVEYAKQIVVYLSSTPAGSRVLEFFMLQLAPKNMVNDKKHVDVVMPDTRSLPYVADLTSLLPMGNKQVGLSMGQVSLIFLVDLMVTPVTLKNEQVLTLIHAVLILWDHYTTSVQEQAREMLVHLIHELVTTKIESDTLTSAKPKIESLVDAVRTNHPRISWSYESNTRKDEDDGASRVPPAMAVLASDIVTIFNLAFDNFSDTWAKEALHWASICPVRHLACRSFQVFRCISVTLDARMLADMLARLSNTIADEQTDYQTFSMEILTTLKVIIGALDPKNLMRYPQLFWTTCACLNTIHEREFYETMGMLEKLIEKFDLSAPDVSDAMLKGQPGKWEGGFEGLQPLLYKGLRSADSLDKTLLVLHKLTALPDCDLVGRDDRLAYCVFANLPRFLQSSELDVVDTATVVAAQRLAQVANIEGHTLLANTLQRFVDKEYLTSTDFMTAAIQALRVSFFPAFDAQSLIFMIGLLTNKTGWFRIKVMEILCELIPLVNMKSTAITTHGPDLISPLLRLLQTEHCAQALEVMDFIMEVATTPMEKHHMRMSMASGSAKAIRKEYEKTQSLYGIPLSSGWSIPMPAIYSSMTRHNVHAVFYTCGDSEALTEQATATPDVEFSGDDGYTDSYFPPQSRAETIRSMEAVADTNVSDLVNTLDSLDDFFDEIDEDNVLTPTGTSHLGVATIPTLPEHSTTLYDEQTAPILRQSLARSSSLANMQDGFTETGILPGTIPQKRQSASSPGYSSMAQSSFSSIDELGGPGPSLRSSTKQQSLQTALSPVNHSRPGLHARSITSPANQFPVSHPTSEGLPSLPTGGSLRSQDDYADQYDEALFSDGENSPFPSLNVPQSGQSRILSGPGPSEYQTTPTSATDTGGAFSLQGMRRGMRRLTGGKSESAKEKEKVRDNIRLRGQSGGHNQVTAAIQSPRVPKVPLEYLNASNSNVAGVSPATSPGI